MPLSSLIGNERIKALLRRAVSDGRIGQGLILAGPDGVGKRRFALALAEALNCAAPAGGDSCGKCLPCRKIAAIEHPDVQVVEPDGQFIKIDQMREMSAEGMYRPYEGRRRVLVIDQAHRLREEAANSILKVLEEPPETTLIILITSRPHSLLETIRSRCQVLSFAPLASAELESFLDKNYKRPVEETRLLARLACGSIGRALSIDLGLYREKRSLMIQMIEASLPPADSITLMNAAEQLGRKLEREDLVDHLEALTVIFADLFHLKLGEPVPSLTNADIAEQLIPLADRTTFDQIARWVEQIESILRALPRNINRQLAMESMLLSV